MNLNFKIMKNKILVCIGLILLFSSNLISKEEVSVKEKTTPQGSIIVMCSPDLFDLTTKWAIEYCRLNPGVKINVSKSADSKTASYTNTGINLGFISNEFYTGIKSESMWKMVVGRDVIVPVINAINPLMNEIFKQGIRSKTLGEFIENPQKHNWGTLLKISRNENSNFYILDDESVIKSIANFTNLNPDRINGIKIASGAEIIAKIQNDPYAIGFCKVKDIIDANGKNLVPNIQFLPIDKNGNGKLDRTEGIYDDIFEFLRGAWIGKYPKALCRNIYSVSSIKPTNEVELGFLKWVLADGQKYLIPYGYSDLVYSERQSQLTDLTVVPVNSLKSARDAYALPKLALILLLGFIGLLFTLDAIGRYLKSHKRGIVEAGSVFPTAFYEDSVSVPKGIFFDKSHTWAFMEKDGTVKLGIDDFLQHITGTLTQIKMKNPGDKIKKGDHLLTINQKGKQLNIYAPVTGIIIEQNSQLLADPSKLNSAPYSDGWVYKIEPANWLRDLQFLFMSDIYNEWLKKEFSRLKDFLAISVKSQKVEYAQIILQDGGDLKDGVLADLGPEIWEDFQTNFIDSFK
jgi:glycine cleavage system H lipoate-binding protein/ABC-type phosphate transport system substrate-binding protein